MVFIMNVCYVMYVYWVSLGNWHVYLSIVVYVCSNCPYINKTSLKNSWNVQDILMKLPWSTMETSLMFPWHTLKLSWYTLETSWKACWKTYHTQPWKKPLNTLESGSNNLYTHLKYPSNKIQPSFKHLWNFLVKGVEKTPHRLICW